MRTWADEEGIPVIEGTYDVESWNDTAGQFGANADTRSDRCRACYRLRLEETARYAAAHGFEGLSTTLSVSPYQYTDIIREEVEHAAAQQGLQAVFEDFRPHYDEATRRSRALGMYRQNYCGCRYSAVEAAREREERKAERAAQKAAERAAQRRRARGRRGCARAT